MTISIRLALDNGSSASTAPSTQGLVAGLATPGLPVTISVDGAIVGVIAPDPVTGAWTFDPKLAPGQHQVVATQSDAAGNTFTATLTCQISGTESPPEFLITVLRTLVSGTPWPAALDSAMLAFLPPLVAAHAVAHPTIPTATSTTAMLPVWETSLGLSAGTLTTAQRQAQIVTKLIETMVRSTYSLPLYAQVLGVSNVTVTASTAATWSVSAPAQTASAVLQPALQAVAPAGVTITVQVPATTPASPPATTPASPPATTPASPPATTPASPPATTPVSPPATVPSVTGAADGYQNGLYYPAIVSIAQNGNAFVAICSGFARFASNAPQTWFLTGADAGTFYLGGNNGSVLFASTNGAYANTSRTSFSVQVNVTDGITTYSQAVTINNTATAIYFGSNVLLDTSSADWAGFHNVEASLYNTANNGAVTISDPSNVFIVNVQEGSCGQLAAAPAVAKNLAGFYGPKGPVTLSSNGVSLAEPVWVAQEQPAYVSLSTSDTIYSFLQPGDLIGQIVAYSDAGINTGGGSFALVQSDGTITMGSTGAIRVAPGQALTPGTKSLTVAITSKSGKITTEVISYTVAAGTLLDATRMTMVVNGSLDNYRFGQTVGTATVANLSGPIKWSVTNPDDCTGIYNGGAALNLFSIDQTSGLLSGTAGQQLPATAPNLIPGTTMPFARPAHTVTLTAISGNVMCRRSFEVPVAWHSGPTLYVGQGMAALHGSNGFETLSACYANFQRADTGIYAGALVLIAPNDDPNYYANGGSHETMNSDYGLRYGWHGPVILRAANTTGARPRLGGLVGSSQGGCGIDGKGYIYCNSGDMIVDGLEVSYVQGWGAPDGDNSHGVSCLRKDADTFGDFYVLNCNLHDGNNTIETGNGPYWTVVQNTIMFNFGTAYVSSGATHGLYCGACTRVVFANNIVYHGTNGHGIKARAKGGLIANNIIIDGERGSMSNCIDMPEEGNFVVSGNILQKGPNAQNPFVIQYGEEQYADPNGQLYRTNTLVLQNNTILMMMPDGNHFGSGICVSVGGCISAIDGSGTTASLTGNNYFLSSPRQLQSAASPYGYCAPRSITESGAVMLSALPTVDLTDKTRFTPAARAGWFDYVSDNSQTYDNFYGVQIDPGTDLPLTLPSNTAPGTVIGKCVGYGANLWANSTANSGNVNPFATGAKWSISLAAQWDGSVPWAPEGRYAVDPISGIWTLAGPAPAAGTTDFVKIRVVSADGAHTCDYRFTVTGTAPFAPGAVRPSVGQP